MITGSILFVIGMILFPLPVPFGLPVMVVGMLMMLKASNKVKRHLIRLSDKNQHTRKVWNKLKVYRRSQKSAKAIRNK